MYGLIKNGILEQKQEAKESGFVTIPDDAVCGQITSDGGKTFTDPPPTLLSSRDLRTNAYPSMGDQLDVLWKQLGHLRLSGKLDLIQDADDMLGEILAVKKRYNVKKKHKK